jgi:glycerol-3-phosphate dehydrogenase
VTLFEAENEVGLAASGANSGILHTGFDSHLGELETALILRAAPLRDEVIRALGIPVRRCGARMRDAPPEVEQNAQILGVPVVRDGSDVLIPGESVTDPIAMTQAFCAEAEHAGVSVRLGQRVVDGQPNRLQRRGELRRAETGGRERRELRDRLVALLGPPAQRRGDQVNRTHSGPRDR